MLKPILRRYLIICSAIFLLTQAVPSVTIKGGFLVFLWAAFILSLLYFIARPIVNLFLLPIHILTLSLTTWIVNIVAVFVWKLLVPAVAFSPWVSWEIQTGLFNLSSFSLSPFWVMVVSGILLTLIIRILDWAIK